MSVPRRVVIKKLKGFSTLTVEGHPSAQLWRDQGAPLGRPRRRWSRWPTAGLQRHRVCLVHVERRLGPRAVDPGLDLLLRFWVSPCSWGG
jgi:hypothetical protein